MQIHIPTLQRYNISIKVAEMRHPWQKINKKNSNENKVLETKTQPCSLIHQENNLAMSYYEESHYGM